MKNIRTNNDLSVGMILTCKNGNKYVVVADDNGSRDVINLTTAKSNGIEVGTGRIAVCGGNSKDGREVIKIEEFTGVPARNRLSEAMKMLVNNNIGLTKMRYTERLETVWMAEDPAVTAARARLDAAQAAVAAAQRDLDSAVRRSRW